MREEELVNMRSGKDKPDKLQTITELTLTLVHAPYPTLGGEVICINAPWATALGVAYLDLLGGHNEKQSNNNYYQLIIKNCWCGPAAKFKGEWRHRYERGTRQMRGADRIKAKQSWCKQKKLTTTRGTRRYYTFLGYIQKWPRRCQFWSWIYVQLSPVLTLPLG